MAGGGRSPSRSERVYRTLLKAYPKEFRRDYGAQMAQAFGDLRRREVERVGRSGLILLWMRTLLDLVLSAASERGRAGLPMPSSSGMIRFGGLAALVGGALGVGLIVRDFLMLYGGVGERAWMLIDGVLGLVGVVATLLLAIGTLGLYACVVEGSRKLATAGLALVLFSDVVGVGGGLYRSLLALTSGYPTGGPGVLFWVTTTIGMLGLAGALLLGVALLRARALGRWSALPLGIWLLPLAVPFASLALATAGGPAAQSLVVMIAITTVPNLLGNLGWVLVGYLLWSGRFRGTAGPVRIA